MDLLPFTPTALLEDQRPISAAEFEAMLGQGLFADEHVELLQGRILMLMAQGPRHVGRVDWLNALFSRLLIETFGPAQDRVAVRIQSTTRMEARTSPEAKRTVPEADVLLARAEPAFTGAPLDPAQDIYLVIEVADTSLEKDLTAKARLYAALGVRLLWVLDLPGRKLHVMRRPDQAGARYEEQTSHASGEVRVDTLPELPAVEVARLFQHME